MKLLDPVIATMSGGSTLFWRIGLYAAIVALLVGFGWFKGNEHGTEKLNDFIAQQATATERLREARVRVIRTVEVKWRTRKDQVVKAGDAIEKGVPTYVTPADDARCVVNRGSVRSHNAAVANDLDPGPPADSDRGDSGVSLSAVIGTAAYNLTLAHRWKVKALACVEAYEGVRKAQP